jgi:hypothetical protein
MTSAAIAKASGTILATENDGGIRPLIMKTPRLFMPWVHNEFTIALAIFEVIIITA